MLFSARALGALIALLGSACSAAPYEFERLGVADAGPAEDAASPPDARIARPDSGGRPDAGARDVGSRDADSPVDLLDRLKSIEGMNVEELFAPLSGTRAFLLKLRQPEDHRRPQGTWFEQRLVLVHREERAPMVLAPTGYGLFGDVGVWTDTLSEPTAALDANQLVVEHRFFGESIASEPSWEHLNIQQSASDSHRIVQLLSAIYQGPWVGTGVSKGGMTAIFHHHFFPDDMAAIVPYVAPISFGANDARYLDWVANIGPADGLCRDRVKGMAIELIDRRHEVAQYFIANYPEAAALQTEVVEALATFPAYSWHWGFWQQLGSPEGCALLPAAGGPVESLAQWFPFDARYLDGFAFDPEISPYSYQVSNELGGQAIDNTHLDASAAEVDYSVLPPVMPMPPPWGAEPNFDPQAMMRVDAFLRNEAEHVLGVYGAWDPWSGGIITVDESNDSVVVVVPQIGHAAQLALLPRREQNDALDRLNRWIGRSPLVATDWSAARARIALHRRDHEWWVAQTLELDRRMLSVRQNASRAFWEL